MTIQEQNRQMQELFLCGRQKWRPWRSWPMGERRSELDSTGPGKHHRLGVTGWSNAQRLHFFGMSKSFPASHAGALWRGWRTGGPYADGSPLRRRDLE